MNKNILIGIIIVIVLIIGGFIIFNNQSANPNTYPSPTETSEATTTDKATTTDNSVASSTAKTYAMAEVITHNSATSCWATIDGNVYNLTTWIKQHPGGEQAILSICGKDGTQAFHAQHGTQQKQADILVTFKIGTLSK
jgi:cytochrome b involved in lipid metabolism